MQSAQFEIVVEKNVVDKFADYLYERENSESTVRKYRRDIEIFLCRMGEERLINKRALMNYKEWLTQNYAVSSANSMLVALNQFLIFLGAERLKIKRLKVQKQLFQPEEKHMTKQDYKRLLCAAQTKKQEKLKLAMETMAGTGIRVSELSYFTVEGVEKGRIEVNNKGKNRLILLPHKLRMKLLCYIRKQRLKSGRIFVTKNGLPLDRSNIWKQMQALYAEAGVEREKIFPHNLRHLFATVYYKITKDLSALADLLGHSSMEVTRIYIASSGREYQKIINMMDLVQ